MTLVHDQVNRPRKDVCWTMFDWASFSVCKHVMLSSYGGTMIFESNPTMKNIWRLSSDQLKEQAKELM